MCRESTHIMFAIYTCVVHDLMLFSTPCSPPIFSLLKQNITEFMSKSVYDDVYALVAYSDSHTHIYGERAALLFVREYVYLLICNKIGCRHRIFSTSSFDNGTSLTTFAPTQSANEHYKYRTAPN